MPSDDLLAVASSSSTNFYDLLGVPSSTSSESDIRRAYRKTALKYHPDKVSTTSGTSEDEKRAAVEKFHLLQVAYDVLTDPKAKAAYDGAREARARKEEREKAARELRGVREGKWDEERRRLIVELERREKEAGVGAKRKRGGEEEMTEQEREIQRIREANEKRRRERQEAVRREREEEDRRAAERDRAWEDATGNGNGNGGWRQYAEDGQGDGAQGGATGVRDIDRTVKVRWLRDGQGGTRDTMDKQRLTDLFSRFGPVDTAFLLKEKIQKLNPTDENKVIVATGAVVFSSIVGAHAAVEDTTRRKRQEEFNIFDSIQWAAGKEPEVLAQYALPSMAQQARDSAAATPSATSSRHGHNGTPPPPPTSTNPALSPFPGRNSGTPPAVSNNGTSVPSFPSFRSAANISRGTPWAYGGLSLEESTMIRLRNAEKRRLEEEIRRREELEAEAEGESNEGNA